MSYACFCCCCCCCCVKLLTEHHLEFLSLKGGCLCSSELLLSKIIHVQECHQSGRTKVSLNNRTNQLFLVTTTVACWAILYASLSSADFFQNQLFQKIISTFQKIISELPPECQTVWIQIRPDALKASDLFSVQTVCKGYQQTVN